MKKLDEKKIEAIEYNDGPLRIIAGPGSGKTRTLVEKVKYLVNKSNVRPNEILIITFTNKATNELKERLDAEKIYDVHIMTYHGFCRKVIREVGKYYKDLDTWTEIDGRRSNAIIWDLMKTLGINERRPQEAIANYSELAKAYLNHKQVFKLLDYDDLLIYTRDIFKELPQIADRYGELIPYVMIDEFQDTDDVQYEIVKLFNKGSNRRITIVGDVDQNIYSWRGGDSNLMINFDKDFKNLKDVYLDTNYRSDLVIVETSQKLIKHNDDRFEDFEIKSISKNKGKFDILDFDSDYHESNYIALKIKDQIKKGVPPSEIAVIVRINSFTRLIETSLNRNHIPYEMVGVERFFKRPIVQRIVAAANVLNEITIDTVKQAALILPTSIGEKRIPEIDNLFNGNEGKVSKPVQRFWNLIHEYKFDKDQKDVRDNLKEIAKELKITGGKGRLADQDDEDAKEAINLFKEQKFVRNVLGSVYGSITNEDEVKSNRVNILTSHSSKGTEYDVVYIPSFVEGHWPSSLSVREGTIDEERRVAYVAITRARKEVHVSYTLSTWNRHWDNKPSRFLLEMDETFVPVEADKDSSDRSKEKAPAEVKGPWVHCEGCVDGKIIQKSARNGGKFYSCNRYPYCKEKMTNTQFWAAVKEKKSQS